MELLIINIDSRTIINEQRNEDFYKLVKSIWNFKAYHPEIYTILTNHVKSLEGTYNAIKTKAKRSKSYFDDVAVDTLNIMNKDGKFSRVDSKIDWTKVGSKNNETEKVKEIRRQIKQPNVEDVVATLQWDKIKTENMISETKEQLTTEKESLEQIIDYTNTQDIEGKIRIVESDLILDLNDKNDRAFFERKLKKNRLLEYVELGKEIVKDVKPKENNEKRDTMICVMDNASRPEFIDNLKQISRKSKKTFKILKNKNENCKLNWTNNQGFKVCYITSNVEKRNALGKLCKKYSVSYRAGKTQQYKESNSRTWYVLRVKNDTY